MTLSLGLIITFIIAGAIMVQHEKAKHKNLQPQEK